MGERIQPPVHTVLVVDDTDLTRYAVVRMLRSAHFAVREASTAAEALHLLADKPDLVILDVNLPDLSGYEVCRVIKADPATASIPVLHLSASFVQSENRVEGLESGADGYLVYPLEPRELVANVVALLRVRHAERALRQQHELLRVTLGSIGDGVVATDSRGAITFINPVALQLTGWTEDEALGKPFKDLFPILDPRTGRPAEDPVGRVLASREGVGVGVGVGVPEPTSVGPRGGPRPFLLLTRDGHRRPVEDTAAPIRDGEGNFVGVVFVFRDITERRRLEEEVQRRSDALAEMDRRKNEFLAMLGHELRNPLAPIRNALHILRLRCGTDQTVAEMGEMMDRQLVQLVRLVDDLLDVSRITRGKIELRKEPVDLTVLLTRTAAAAAFMLSERRHRLEVDLPTQPLLLEADPARLDQVFSNLLSNACKYTPLGGRVRLSAEREGDTVVARVTDTGIGIRAEMLEQVFEMFQQADRLPNVLSEGLGLGLPLVRRLVELHGGTVLARSDGPGLGSEFVVRLPLSGQPAHGEALEDDPDRSAPLAPAPPMTGGALRVLIVDDNDDGARSLALLLRLGGHQVQVANDGPAALELAASFRPQAVLLDIGLPRGMNGYEVARRLRQTPGLESALLVAMTGYGQPDDIVDAHAAGFDHHLTKPAKFEDVSGLLATRRSAQGARM